MGVTAEDADGSSMLEAIASLERLTRMLRDGAELDRAIDEYLEARWHLARTFKRRAEEKVAVASRTMDEVRARILS